MSEQDETVMITLACVAIVALAIAFKSTIGLMFASMELEMKERETRSLRLALKHFAESDRQPAASAAG